MTFFGNTPVDYTAFGDTNLRYPSTTYGITTSCDTTSGYSALLTTFGEDVFLMTVLMVSYNPYNRDSFFCVLGFITSRLEHRCV